MTVRLINVTIESETASSTQTSSLTWIVSLCLLLCTFLTDAIPLRIGTHPSPAMTTFAKSMKNLSKMIST